MTPRGAHLIPLAGCPLILAAGLECGVPVERHAVGTYIGADDCTYAGGPGVFMPGGTNSTPSATPAPGPRLITGAGRIEIRCPAGEREAEAVEPTALAIRGPAAVKVGAPGEAFSAHLVAGAAELRGEPALEWTLGHDCKGIAEYGPVPDTQNDVGADRTRTLAARAAGACTVIVSATTGIPSSASSRGRAFQIETLVKVE